VTGSLSGYHAVLIIGYDDVGQYFVVKNSWGTWWGESGFFKIAYAELNSLTKFGKWTIAYVLPTRPLIDFNGDGKPDILWRNTTSGQNAVWYLDGVTVTGSAVLDSMADQTWTIVGTGDFNGDGKPDILWRNTTSGQNAVWYLNGVTVTGFAVLNSMTDQTWQIVGPK